jgi:hypothetical protein
MIQHISFDTFPHVQRKFEVTGQQAAVGFVQRSWDATPRGWGRFLQEGDSEHGTRQGNRVKVFTER